VADIVVPGDGLRPLEAIYGQLTVVADATCALKGTGRLPVSAADTAALGPLAGRLPLIA